mmetsp:Transcript_5576/g.10178  ORF Transcript_5576/g.10178 Transcript_5576/m.10178 type:complete len:102 (-) Transcript_5576:223-528(-)|eukprot:CAMPEP_0201600948 /NCGR_PEP_ID=MMETSP0492-20130828/1988_1 /ASSEMBLY_ACC=CAM_ASM_000837 /TAXON_ID=420259 /ORGANISM="Thalassiosira gravida, Strain GMp14c1" /LENGTH=101 /DNA_ID=CAMNT_0048063969 /DNA_START=172 /DNA_END=477 /DNA_ORIENTATION=+
MDFMRKKCEEFGEYSEDWMDELNGTPIVEGRHGVGETNWKDWGKVFCRATDRLSHMTKDLMFQNRRPDPMTFSANARDAQNLTESKENKDKKGRGRFRGGK